MQTVTGSCEDEARDFLVEEKCKDKDGKCKLWEDSELRPNERDEARSDVLDRMKHERKKFDYFSECRGAYGDVQFLIYDVLRSVEGRRVWFCSLIGPVRILLGPEVALFLARRCVGMTIYVRQVVLQGRKGAIAVE
ncbi:hypothetical protein AXG93_517s1350 [Marchantia polymorpha subsp. ruderalis]|uniref:Uncharacterized protein n=1 Tax=Marchantia polymorpha subsp. ruderalis TaxID=1480154 RepID=A0A176VIB2_MARPO|nr:hypothetical protein AXG93_517s1350 [Marchantia polymorpha subsp. ruderalis]